MLAKGFQQMCGRYRLTQRRLMEIEGYYGIDDVTDLDMWERQFNIPPGEMAAIVFERGGQRHLTAGLWTLLGKTKLFNSGAVALFCEELNVRRSPPSVRFGGVLVASMMVG
jgi:hypothetical protein